MVEQRSPKPQVVGSNPATPASRSSDWVCRANLCGGWSFVLLRKVGILSGLLGGYIWLVNLIILGLNSSGAGDLGESRYSAGSGIFRTKS